MVGESMKGKDKRIMPLLYALAFFAVTEAEMIEIDLSFEDKETIKKVRKKPVISLVISLLNLGITSRELKLHNFRQKMLN